MTIKPNQLKSQRQPSLRSRVPGRRESWQQWLDTLTILTWGILLLRFWLTGQINILLHPDYVWLAYSAGFALVGLALLRLAHGLLQALRHRSLRPRRDRPRQPSSSPPPSSPAAPQHFVLFPPHLSSSLLLAVALFGLQFTPQPFASDIALNRGVTDTLTLTRSQPQAFRVDEQPESRSLIEWVRTLNVYPEPDAYTGQSVNVNGFAIHPAGLPDNYLMLARFVITCCAADAYPVGLPVKLPAGDRSAYPPDKWFQVEGQMITETLEDKRQLVIAATTLSEIPTPANPYDY